jgi:RNA polymerase sigma-70 factor, ECF subfamily
MASRVRSPKFPAVPVIKPADREHVLDISETVGETVAARAMNLLERCQRDDPAAWRELFARRASQIYRWAVLLGLGPAGAEDATQDVLATAARRIESCRDEIAMTSWLYQITRRVVANHRRREWLRRCLPFQTAQPNGEAADAEHEHPRDLAAELEVRRCLRQLPPDLVEVLVMIEIVGLTRDEAAKILGLPAGTVGSRTRRARAAFMEQWHRDEDDAVARPLEEIT